jgi:hypothetical protein
LFFLLQTKSGKKRTTSPTSKSVAQKKKTKHATEVPQPPVHQEPVPKLPTPAKSPLEEHSLSAYELSAKRKREKNALFLSTRGLDGNYAAYCKKQEEDNSSGAKQNPAAVATPAVTPPSAKCSNGTHTQDRVEPCRHEKYLEGPSYVRMEQSNYFATGEQFGDTECDLCTIRFIHTGKPESGMEWRAGLRAPVYICANHAGDTRCNHVVCGVCFAEKAAAEAGEVGGNDRSRRATRKRISLP